MSKVEEDNESEDADHPTRPLPTPRVHVSTRFRHCFMSITRCLHGLVDSSGPKTDVNVDLFYRLLAELDTIGDIIDALWNLLLQCITYKHKTVQCSFATRLVVATLLPFVDIGDILATVAWSKIDTAGNVIDDIMNVALRLTPFATRVRGWPVRIRRRHRRMLQLSRDKFLGSEPFPIDHRHVMPASNINNILYCTYVPVSSSSYVDKGPPSVPTFPPPGCVGYPPLVWAMMRCLDAKACPLSSSPDPRVVLALCLGHGRLDDGCFPVSRACMHKHRWVGGWAMADIVDAYGPPDGPNRTALALLNPAACKDKTGPILTILPDPAPLVGHPSVTHKECRYVLEGPGAKSTQTPVGSDVPKRMFGDPKRYEPLTDDARHSRTANVFECVRSTHVYPAYFAPGNRDLPPLLDHILRASDALLVDYKHNSEQCVEGIPDGVLPDWNPLPQNGTADAPTADYVLYCKEQVAVDATKSILGMAALAAAYDCNGKQLTIGPHPPSIHSLGVVFMTLTALEAPTTPVNDVEVLLLQSTETLYLLGGAGVIDEGTGNRLCMCLAVMLVRFMKRAVARSERATQELARLLVVIEKRLLDIDSAQLTRTRMHEADRATPAAWLDRDLRSLAMLPRWNRTIVFSALYFVLLFDCVVVSKWPDDAAIPTVYRSGILGLRERVRAITAPHDEETDGRPQRGSKRDRPDGTDPRPGAQRTRTREPDTDKDTADVAAAAASAPPVE